ncbi:CsiV family protein, partial [Testudinibacter aquarius]
MTLSKSFWALTVKSLALCIFGAQAYADQTAPTQNSVPAPAPITSTENTTIPPVVTTEQNNENQYATQINVELIIFQRLFEQDSLNQKFPELTSAIPLEDALLPSPELPQARTLAPDQMQLNEIFTKFQQHGAYIPFYHQAWSQPLLQQSASFPLRIQSDLSTVPAIDGRLLIWQGDKIELNFNLAFSYDSLSGNAQQAFANLAQSAVSTVPDIDAVKDSAKVESQQTAQRHTIQYQSQSSYTDNQM